MNNDNHTSQQLSHETAAAGRKPTITIYSSIDNLGTAVEQASLDGVKVLTIIPDIDPASNQIQSMDDKTTQALSSAEILVTEPKLLKQLLEWDKDRGDNKLLSRLKWCQCTFAGVDALYPLKTTPSFQLTRFSGPFGPIMAEWCIGRIIAHERNFGASWKDQQDRRWPTIESPVFSYRYLHELTVVILGCGGTIGRHIGRVTKAMGMRTVGFVRSSRTTQQRDDADSVRDELTTNLEQALAHSDYIISVLPSTPETKGLLTLDILQRANELRSNQSAATDGNDNHQPPPVLINCGRGDLISSDTLLEALDKRFLNAAILDVTEEEPLSANSRLWDDPRITISPHVSGLTKADDVPKLLMQNYDRFVNQLPLLHSVRWETLTTEYYQQASSPGSDRSASEALISPSVTANSEPHDEILRIPSDISHDSLSNNLHSNKHILLGVTGSVAAVKAPEIAVRLRQETNTHIKILLTTGAQNFWGQSEEYNPQMWNALQTELSNGNVKLLRKSCLRFKQTNIFVPMCSHSDDSLLIIVASFRLRRRVAHMESHGRSCDAH